MRQHISKRLRALGVLATAVAALGGGLAANPGPSAAGSPAGPGDERAAAASAGELWIVDNPGSAVSGEPIRLEGTVPARLAGSAVRLQRLTPRGWTTEARATATRSSHQFSVVADAPRVESYRTFVYRIASTGARRPVVSQKVEVEVVADRGGPVLDGRPGYFALEPDKDPDRSYAIFQVELDAGDEVEIGFSGYARVGSRERDDFYIQSAGLVGSRGTAEGLVSLDEARMLTAAAAGTYRVVIALDGATPVEGLIWLSSPLYVPIEADGPSVRIPPITRPGQVPKMLLEREEGDLFTTECAPVSCEDRVELYPRGDPGNSNGNVGPVDGALWNPKVSGGQVIVADPCCGRRLWVNSVRPELIDPDNFTRTVSIDRPGAMPSFRFAGAPGDRYRLTVTPVSLTSPDGDRGFLYVGGFVYGDGFIRNGYGAITRDLTFTTADEWTLFIDPDQLDLGEVRIEIVALEDEGSGP